MQQDTNDYMRAVGSPLLTRFSEIKPAEFVDTDLCQGASGWQGEETLDVEAVKRMRPMQPGDVTATFADIGRLKALCGYAPKVPIEAGIPRFVEWYRSFQRDSAGRRSPL